MQALTACLTLQEQRITNMSRQFMAQQASLDEAAEKRSELMTLSSQIATEQGLWTTFSSRLDELERALPAAL